MKHYIIEQMKPLILAASGLGVLISELTNKYIFSEKDYLIYLIIAVSLDLLTGVAKVWAKEGHKAITSKGIRMTIMKFIQYGSFLIITHVLANVSVGATKVSPFAFVKDWAYLLLLLIEVKSVYENIVAIDNRLDFVKGIIAKLDVFIKKEKKEDK